MRLTVPGASTPPDGYAKIHELTRLALVRAAANGRSGTQAWERAVRESLREICAAAHDQQVHVEQVLIVLKQCWAQLTETTVEHKEAEERLSRLVSLCIREYYRLASDA